MDSLAQVLYNYAQEYRVMDHIQTREYHSLSAVLEEEWEAFCGALPPDQGRRLESLLARRDEAGCLEDRAAFLAGVSIGLDLARF